MRYQGTNNQTAWRSETDWPNALEQFDHLPRLIRGAMQECNFSITVKSIAKILKTKGPFSTIFEIDESERQEIQNFNNLWPTKFGDYPHVAGDATIMRYDEVSLHRHKPRIRR